ncbi:MAG: 4Fe-4S binding protein [Proteobacteria bacterium]|nr:4Fe-4S binding protein [Pseudomonadota bacterium]MBU4013564.1 4Fe-4S binding protein [Pseudomonadota bacterium]MBU4067453.1 4Fe-4S binding protein [Pseudomonadota bacterium]MBU4101761.1 4Fe-4S binding protein [Pseudomonadota bacterium]MBU4127431.1 4Fe-4S binding protein [Pseudomonadota bacterium]
MKDKSNDIYEQLADALGSLPNGFTRTQSNTEIQLLKKIFSLEEASIASRLSGRMESVDTIAERFRLPEGEMRSQLMKMVKRGLVWFEKKGRKPGFRLAPFIVGIYEAQLDIMDHEFAHLFEQYMADGGAADIMKPQPALHRVVPARQAVKTEWILPYDDVKAILNNARIFRLRNCICRVQRDQIGRQCTFPLKMCLSFSSFRGSPGEYDISKEEALAALDRAEEIGLVHTVSNIIKGIGYICNCCGCCCGILRGITEWGIENSVAHANYYAVIDSDVCTGCGLCMERCQVNAISEHAGIAVVDREKCIGCGLCVTGCPEKIATLNKKPASEIIDPPVDFTAWEQERQSKRNGRG